MFAGLSVPHSTAAVERIFSMVNRIKDRDSNRLLVPTVSGRLLAAQHAKRSKCCTGFRASDELVETYLSGEFRKRYFDMVKSRKIGSGPYPATNEAWESFEEEALAVQEGVDYHVEAWGIVNVDE